METHGWHWGRSANTQRLGGPVMEGAVMLAQLIRRAKTIPRFRLMTLSGALVLYLNQWIPLLVVPFLGKIDDYPTLTYTGWERGGSWAGWLALGYLVLEALRFFGRGPRRIAQWHDVFTTVAAALLSLLAALLVVHGLIETIRAYVEAQWGLILPDIGWGIDLLCYGWLAAAAWQGAQSDGMQHLIDRITVEVRDARAELRKADAPVHPVEHA